MRDYLDRGSHYRTSSGTRSYPGYKNWPFTVHSLWWNTLHTGGRGLVLPQLGMLDFAGSPREALEPLKSGWR